ncbi:MAG: DinB family protein [Acidobacteriota bacterium]
MTYEELLRHMEWADAEIWRAVLTTPAALEDEEIRERLHHVHLVPWVWLSMCRGEAPVLRPISDFPQLRDIFSWSRPVYEELRSYRSGLSEEELDGEVEMPWREHLEKRFGTVHPTRQRDGLNQVVLHGQYHRGQINTRLRALGGEPPMVDYIAWIWQGRPEPDWVE